MTDTTFVNRLSVKDPENFAEEDSPRETLNIDEAVDRAVDKITIKLGLTLLVISLVSINLATGINLTVYTGYIPYQHWRCVSRKCFDLKDSAESADKFISQETLCENDLVAGTDFDWTYKKQTFSTDWNIYCKDEAKLSLVSSFVFLGMFLGVLSSTAVFDRIGRKRGAMIGSFVNFAAVALSSAAPNYQLLLVLRIIYGFGLVMTYTGAYCWAVELVPQRLRNITSNIFALFAIKIGDLCLIGSSYFLNKWQYVYLTVAGINALALLLLFLCPIPGSPRFSLIKGRKEEAMETLKVLAEMSNNKIALDKIDLVFEKRDQSYLEQIKDFRSHPHMRRETLLGMSVWFTVALITISYQFGWSKIGAGLELHSIYLIAAMGNSISYIVAVPLCRLLGRKKSLLFSLAWVIIMNGVASLDVKFSADWALEHVASIMGSMGASTAFVLAYLLSGELAPTSHRGMILCLSSSCARVGSFIGPYVNLLYGVADRRVPLALFAGLSLMACGVVWVLPDTTGRGVPETPGDVEILAKKERSF